MEFPDFFDFDNPNKKKLKNESVITRQVHDYDQLIVLSGINADFEDEVKNNELFSYNWSIISTWNENARY